MSENLDTDDARSDDGTDDGTRGASTRRTLLQGLAATAVGGGFLGLAGSASAASTRDRYSEYLDQYDTVVDVTEAGVDDTGTESVTSDLEDLRADDTLLLFPPGEYYMDEQFRFTGFDNFGLAGDDATLVPANYYDFHGPQYRLFRLGVSYSPGGRLLFEGFRVDQTGTDTGIRALDAVVDDDLTVRDVTVEGKHDSGTFGPLRVAVSDDDGTGLVENFSAPDGGAFTKYTPNAGNLWRGPTGVMANYPHTGTLRFVDCELGAFPDNGLYASKGGGRVGVEGGTYANSDTAQIRIGGPDSYVRGARVVVDQNRPDDRGQRGVRVEHGTSVLLNDVTIRNTVAQSNAHAVSIQGDANEVRLQNVDVTMRGDGLPLGVYVSSSVGNVDVLDTTITQDVPGGTGILVRDGDGEVKVIRTTVDGDAGDEVWGSAIRNERDGTFIARTTVDQTGSPDRRALTNWGDDVTLYRDDFRVSGTPIVEGAHSAWVEEIYAESTSGRSAIDFYSESSDAYVKESTLVNGVTDRGCEGLVMWGNDGT